MQKHFIYLTSVTYAVRGQRLLAQSGIVTKVSKDTVNIRKYGCGYGLELRGDPSTAVQLLQQAGIRVVEVVNMGM
ncbi:putative Se/S carrier-like protein [Oscillospiraceae bacterium MB08-C2-2]|nr:putative Se/S carrier-like protein [Oscillospiraceae bacterium MB08-C2-2]